MLLLLVLQIVIGIFKDVFLIKSGQQIDARLILGYYKHLLKNNVFSLKINSSSV